MDIESNDTTVTDAIHISALLIRLKNHNCTLKIKSLTPSGDFITVGLSEILNIDISENNILFDAIDKSTFAVGQEIKIFAKHKGIDIHFKTTITKLTTRNHSVYFNTQLPISVTHKQRRQQYRAELENLWKIPVTIVEKPPKKTMTAYIYNISTGGINIRSSTENFNKIKNDSIIDTLIQLPDDAMIQCKLLVRKTQTNQTAGFQQLAGQFLNLDAKQEKSIQTFVYKVERSHIKNREKHSAV